MGGEGRDPQRCQGDPGTPGVPCSTPQWGALGGLLTQGGSLHPTNRRPRGVYEWHPLVPFWGFPYVLWGPLLHGLYLGGFPGMEGPPSPGLCALGEPQPAIPPHSRG